MAHETHDKGSAASHGIGRYIIIWLALMGFTVLTVVTGRIDLGSANIFIAMIIALTKATLVVLFFMHLYDEGGVNRIVFVVSVLFLVVLLLGVFADLMWRLPISLPNEGPLPTLPKGSLGTHPAPH